MGLLRRGRVGVTRLFLFTCQTPGRDTPKAPGSFVCCFAASRGFTACFNMYEIFMYLRYIIPWF